MTTNKTVPQRTCAIYKAAATICANGPQTTAALFFAVDFGANSTRAGKLERAFDLGWLRMVPGDMIDVTESTKQHFAGQGPKERYIGQRTPAPQWDVFASPGLSRKNIPNRRGPRADAPAICGARPTFHRG